jgi:hypothetical protein
MRKGEGTPARKEGDNNEVSQGSDVDRFVSAIGLKQLHERGTKRKTIRATNFIVQHGNSVAKGSAERPRALIS